MQVELAAVVASTTRPRGNVAAKLAAVAARELPVLSKVAVTRSACPALTPPAEPSVTTGIASTVTVLATSSPAFIPLLRTSTTASVAAPSPAVGGNCTVTLKSQFAPAANDAPCKAKVPLLEVS